jgi:hypothetical protein
MKAIYIDVKYVMIIIDMMSTNAINTPSGANVKSMLRVN